MKINEADLHHHLKSRMLQRGISKEEIEHTINKGWNAGDAKEGVEGKVLVFTYNNYWEGKYFEEKEVTVRQFNNEVQHLGEQKRRCYPKCLCQRTTNILPWTKENS
jgi:hypothetical protein